MYALSRECFVIDKLDLFWRFVNERQLVWHRRFVEKRDPPWTDDLILRHNRFTNVYRELDPGTRYAMEGILGTDNTAKSKAFNIMFYRLIGAKETHRAVGFLNPDSFDSAAVISKMKSLRSAGKHVFTGAYLVSPYSNEGANDKIINVASLFKRISSGFSGAWNRLSSAGSAEEAYSVIRGIDGFGDFLSYQVLVDLLYPIKSMEGKSLLPFSNDDFVVPGPGARRGISMMLDGEAEINGAEVVRWLRGNQKQEFQRLCLKFPYLKDGSGKEILLTLANVQNCLCEFHKYVKISEGTGRARRRFIEPLHLPQSASLR